MSSLLAVVVIVNPPAPAVLAFAADAPLTEQDIATVFADDACCVIFKVKLPRPDVGTLVKLNTETFSVKVSVPALPCDKSIATAPLSEVSVCIVSLYAFI